MVWGSLYRVVARVAMCTVADELDYFYILAE